MDTYPKRMQFCVWKAGGQSELARKASRLAGRKISTQNVQQSCDESGGKRGKARQGSMFTPYYADAVGISAIWLAKGGTEYAPTDWVIFTNKSSITSGKITGQEAASFVESEVKDLTWDAMRAQLMQDWMTLGPSARRRYAAEIHAAALAAEQADAEMESRRQQNGTPRVVIIDPKNSKGK